MLGFLARWSWSLRLWFLWSNPWVQCYGSLCRWAAVCPLTWPRFLRPLKAQLSRLAVGRTFLEHCHSALEDDWAALLDIPLRHACLPFLVDQERYSTICPGESQALSPYWFQLGIHSPWLLDLLKRWKWKIIYTLTSQRKLILMHLLLPVAIQCSDKWVLIKNIDSIS